MDGSQKEEILKKIEAISSLEAALSGQAALIISQVTTVKMGLNELKKCLENSDVVVVPKGTPESAYTPPPSALPADIENIAVDYAPRANVISNDHKNGKGSSSVKIVVSKPKKFSCESCDFKTDYSESLDRHKKIHEKQKELGFEIPKGKNGVASDSVEFVAAVNNISNPFQCPHCRNRFPKKAILNSHLLNKHNSKAKSHKCEKCNTVFSSLNALRDHASIHDSNSKLLKCNSCDFSTSFKGNMTAHLAMAHGDVKIGDSDAMVIA